MDTNTANNNLDLTITEIRNDDTLNALNTDPMHAGMILILIDVLDLLDNYHNTTVTTNNFTVFANWFNWWSYHVSTLQLFRLFKAVCDASMCQIIRTHFNSHTVNDQNTNVVFTILPKLSPKFASISNSTVNIALGIVSSYNFTFNFTSLPRKSTPKISIWFPQSTEVNNYKSWLKYYKHA